MPYSKTNWVNGTTALSQANLNNIENGVAACVTTNGDTGMTAALPVTVTLSGTDKVFLDFTATDGKRYQIAESFAAGGALYLKNVTDNVVLFLFGPSASTIQLGGKAAVVVDASGSGAATSPKIAVGPNAPAAPAKFDLWAKTPFS